MSMPLLKQLEVALRERNPNLAQSLKPGLPAAKIRQILQRAGVDGDVEPVVTLFTWKNGCQPDPGNTMRLFPTLDYQFWDLKRMVIYFTAFQSLAKSNPKLLELASRFFPLFWNGASAWLAVDLQPAHHNQVVVIDAAAERPVEPLCHSFDQFLREAIQPSGVGNPRGG